MRKNVFLKRILILFCFCLLFAMQAPGYMRAGRTKCFSVTVKVGKKGVKESNYSVVDSVNHNGKNVDGDMDPLEVSYDEEVKLPFCQFQSKQGWNFKGWYLRDNISYKDQSKVKNLSSTDGDTVTLKAIWENPSGFHYKIPMSAASIFSTGNIVIWVGVGVLVVAIVVLSIVFVRKKKE
ncbi:MAG: hypothetical protein K5639_00670 [Eubacterium sp.]|nr:hypothetical protein [Eubacterium sp.]